MSYVTDTFNLLQAAEDICRELNRIRTGEHWQIKPRGEHDDWHGRYYVNLIDPTNSPEAELYVNSSHQGHKGRLSIGGKYPRHNGSDYPCRREDRPDSITIDRNREPGAKPFGSGFTLGGENPDGKQTQNLPN